MEAINLSLAEQMRFDEFEIARRKELLEFTQADVVVLASAQPVILENLESIVGEFYTKQTSIDEIALIIGDSGTLRRLRSAQSTYITDLFSGYYDMEYVNNRLRIGLVHKRIGVEPKYYLSAIKVLKDILTNAIVTNIDNPTTAANTLKALDKLLYFDTELVFDTYIGSMLSEIEAAKDKAVRYARGLQDKVAERTAELAKLSRTDSLTRLLNKRAFVEQGRVQLAHARRAGTCISLIYFDVDGFKSINDNFGHYRGDETLKAIGTVLSEVMRETDIAGRIGGDEFCVILPSTDYGGAQIFDQRLTKKIRETANVGVSIGIATTGPETHDTWDELTERADQAMYEVKAQHRADTLAQQTNLLEVQEAPSESCPETLPESSPNLAASG